MSSLHKTEFWTRYFLINKFAKGSVGVIIWEQRISILFRGRLKIRPQKSLFMTPPNVYQFLHNLLYVIWLVDKQIPWLFSNESLLFFDQIFFQQTCPIFGKHLTITISKKLNCTQTKHYANTLSTPCSNLSWKTPTLYSGFNNTCPKLFTKNISNTD